MESMFGDREMKVPDGIHFWMQDSFGGNSKTTIIANDSPSIEDASGNVTALQRQIQQLQGQLSFLMKHYDISRSVPSYQQSRLADLSEEYESLGERNTCDDHNTLSIPKRKIVEHKEALRASNAWEILSKYDIVIDATDNAPSRYLISDCCVVLGEPLVSGAAVGLEGQLTVYNYDGGPCYHCLFPTPPPATTCQRCSDSGVLGVVPGIIGCLQALEAIKIPSAIGEPLSGRMLLLDALSARIRIVKIRGRSLHCEVCGVNAAFTQQKFQEFDYEKFTQSPLFMSPLKLNLLPTEARISCKEFNERVVKGEVHVLVDVRPAHHFKIVSLPKSMNIPLSSLAARLPEISSALKQEEEQDGSDTVSAASLYVVCRRDNDSQRAIEYLRKMGFASAKDIVGGLESWARDVDPNFPTY